MGQGNGLDRDAENTERLISLVARLNDALRDFSVEQRLSSERLGRVESAIEKAREAIARVEHHIAEARDDIDEVKDQTDPKGFRLLDPTRYPLGGDGHHKEAGKDSGSSLAIKDGKVKVALSTSRAGELLKLGLSLGLGGGLTRLVQWLVNGH